MDSETDDSHGITVGELRSSPKQVFHVDKIYNSLSKDKIVIFDGVENLVEDKPFEVIDISYIDFDLLMTMEVIEK